MAHKRTRRRRSNPSGLGFIDPFTMAIGATTAVAALAPSVMKLLGVGTPAPAAPVATTDYQKDLQSQIALKTQAAVAAKQFEAAQVQGQSAVEVAQIKASSLQKILTYSAVAVAVGLGVYVLVRVLKKKGTSA